MNRIELLYFKAREFIGTLEELPSGLFRAVVHYRSLKTERMGMLEIDPQPRATARDALESGWTSAMAWAQEQADDHQGRI